MCMIMSCIVCSVLLRSNNHINNTNNNNTDIGDYNSNINVNNDNDDYNSNIDGNNDNTNTIYMIPRVTTKYTMLCVYLCVCNTTYVIRHICIILMVHC